MVSWNDKRTKLSRSSLPEVIKFIRDLFRNCQMSSMRSFQIAQSLNVEKDSKQLIVVEIPKIVVVAEALVMRRM